MVEPHGSKAWKVVSLVFVFMLVNYADKAVIGLSSVPIMRDLELSSRQFGELGSAFFLLFSVSGVAVGFLANHVRTKVLMVFMALAWGLALLPLGFRSGFGLLLASRILLGAAEGPSFPIAIHAVYKWFDDPQRALPTSIVASGAAFGTGVIAPLLTFIIVHHGWRTAFVALGCCGLVWAAVWFAVAEDGPVDLAGEASGAARTRVAYRRLLLSRTAIGVFLAGFGAYWVIALNITWLANYLVRALDLPPARAAWIVGLPSVLQMLLAPMLAWLSQRLSRRGWPTRLSRGVLGALCVVTAGVAMMCMCLLEFGIVKVCLIGLSFSVGSVIFTLGSTLIGEIAPPAQRGAMLGITNSVQTLAGLCAPLVMGQIIDLGSDPKAGFRAGFLSAGGLVAALGILAAVLIDPEADKRRLT
jgi:MFS family permease